MATVEQSVESVLDDLSTNYWRYSDDIMEYATRRGFNAKIANPPDSEFPEEADRPLIDTEVPYKSNGDRLFTPEDITGGFPEYVAPAEINWGALYDALAVHKLRTWQSSQMDTLIAKMQELILGDEAWLRGEYQQFVFDGDRDRRLQALDDGLRIIASRHAARGFKIPTSMLTAQENEIIQKYQFDSANASRELGKSVMLASKEFQQFGMKQGLDYEQINMGFTQAYNAALLEPIKLKVSVYKQQLETSAEVFGNKVKEVLLKFEAEKTSWEVTNTYNETLYKVEKFPWELYKIQVDAAASKFKEEVELYKGQVRADVDALIAGSNSMAEIAKSGASITVYKGKPA